MFCFYTGSDVLAMLLKTPKMAQKNYNNFLNLFLNKHKMTQNIMLVCDPA